MPLICAILNLRVFLFLPLKSVLSGIKKIHFSVDFLCTCSLQIDKIRDAQSKLEQEECAGDMGQRSHVNYEAAQDAQLMTEQGECAGDMVEDEMRCARKMIYVVPSRICTF